MFKFDWKDWAIVGLSSGILYAVLNLLKVNNLLGWILPNYMATATTQLQAALMGSVALLVIVLEIVYVLLGRSLAELFTFDKMAFWKEEHYKLLTSFFLGRFGVIVCLAVIANSLGLVVGWFLPVLVGAIISTIVVYLVYRALGRTVPG